VKERPLTIVLNSISMIVACRLTGKVQGILFCLESGHPEIMVISFLVVNKHPGQLGILSVSIR